MRTNVAALCAFIGLCSAGCTASQPQSTVTPMETREDRATSAFKTQYKGVVLGTDVHGPQLDVFIDVEHMSEMDEDAEIAMKEALPKKWKSIWIADHPHAHAVLRLRLRNYFGQTLYTASARV